MTSQVGRGRPLGPSFAPKSLSTPANERTSFFWVFMLDFHLGSVLLGALTGNTAAKLPGSTAEDLEEVGLDLHQGKSSRINLTEGGFGLILKILKPLFHLKFPLDPPSAPGTFEGNFHTRREQNQQKQNESLIVPK